MKTVSKLQASKANANEENGNAIVSFHIGRGGRFHYQGHKTFAGYHDMNQIVSWETNDLSVQFENYASLLPNQLDEKYDAIVDAFSEAEYNGDFSALNKLGITKEQCGKLVYIDLNGKHMIECDHDGTGILDWDGEYDTDYSQRVSDCSDEELHLIVNEGSENEPAYQYALATLIESGEIEVEY